MTKKVKVEPADFNSYFKGLDLKKRVGVMETAKNLLDVQKRNDTLLADAPIPSIDAEKQGLA
jgi:hypothetical protein